MSTPSSCDNPHASGGRYPECPPDAHAQPSELPCNPARTYPRAGSGFIMAPACRARQRATKHRRRTVARIRLPGFCRLRHFRRLRRLRHFCRLRFGASAQRSAVYLRADSRTRASSRAPEYFQNRTALKQRTVENVHSQRFQKLSKGSRTVGACYSTRLSTSWSNFPSVLPSFLRMTVLGSLRTKLRVLPLSFLRVMVSPLSATTVNPPV